MFFIGIDYSITSTGVAVQIENGNPFYYSYPRFNPKETLSNVAVRTQELLKEAFVTFVPVERLKADTKDYTDIELIKTLDAIYLAKAVIKSIRDVVLPLKCPGIVTLEGLSFGSVGGRGMDIAGYGYILRRELMELKDEMLEDGNYLQILIISPTTVKKFATGKGNAGKKEIIESFLKNDTDEILKKIITDYKDFLVMKNNPRKPLDDLIDSYYLLRYGIENRKEF